MTAGRARVTNTVPPITLKPSRKAAGRGRSTHTGGRPTAPGTRGAKRFWSDYRGNTVSIVRIGLAETKGFAGGYDAIFGGQKKEGKAPAKKAKPAAKKGGKTKAKKKTPSAKK